jgi:hypothetical protein
MRLRSFLSALLFVAIIVHAAQASTPATAPVAPPIDSVDAVSDSSLAAEYGPWDNRLRIYGGGFRVPRELTYPLVGIDYRWSSNAFPPEGKAGLGASMGGGLIWILPYADCGLQVQMGHGYVGLTAGVVTVPDEHFDVYPLLRPHAGYITNMYGLGVDIEGGILALRDNGKLATAPYLMVGLAIR